MVGRASSLRCSLHAGARQLAQPGMELVFSILTRRLLRRGEFAPRDDLVAKTMAWIAEYDRTAKPFAWTYNGQPLKVA